MVARNGAGGVDGASDNVSDLLPYLRLDEMGHEPGLFSPDAKSDAVIVTMSILLDKHAPSNKRVFDSNGKSGEDDSSQPANKNRRIG